MNEVREHIIRACGEPEIRQVEGTRVNSTKKENNQMLVPLIGNAHPYKLLFLKSSDLNLIKPLCSVTNL